MTELPERWETRTFGDLFRRLQYGLTAKADHGRHGLRFLRITDIKDTGLIDWNLVPSCVGADDHVGRYKLADGDFVFARSGSIEKAARVQCPPPAVFASYLIRGVPVDRERADWLAWFIRSPLYLEQVRAAAAGIGLSNVNATKLSAVVVPIPPLPEQHRIVKKLDNLFQHSNSARQELARIPRLVERYKQAVFAAVMETDQANQAWPRVSLEELLTEGPTNGYSPRSGENPRGTLSLKLTATTRGVMDLSDRALKRLNEVIPKDSKFWLRAGDILIQRSNSLEYVGMAAIYDGPPHTYIYPDLMIRIRVASPTMARWIWRYCSSASGRRYFTSNATGTAGNMPKINGSTIRGMQIPLPPLDQLDTLLGKVDRALDAIDALQGEAGKARKLLDRLDQAILAKAFRGELRM